MAVAPELVEANYLDREIKNYLATPSQERPPCEQFLKDFLTSCGGFNFEEQKKPVNRPSPELEDGTRRYIEEASKTTLLSVRGEQILARIVEPYAQLRRAVRESFSNNLDPEERELLFARKVRASLNTDELLLGHAAANLLIESNRRWVIAIAIKFQGRGLPLDDLIQAGNEAGLPRAVDKYDWRQGFKFSTYATNWIRQAMGREIDYHGRVKRLPIYMIRFIRAIHGAEDDLLQELGRFPTYQQIAHRLTQQTGKKVEPSKVEAALTYSQIPASLEAPVSEEGDSQFGDFITDPLQPEIPDLVWDRQRQELIQQVLEEQLDPRHQRVLQWRLGLSDGKGRTLEEIGAGLGVTRERVRQIEVEALCRLRQPSVRFRLKQLLA